MRWRSRSRNGFSATGRSTINKTTGPAETVVQAQVIHGDVVIASRDRTSRLDRAAERLAEAVEAQWRAESQARSLHRPHPLRLRWSSTDRDVAATADLRVEGDLGDVVEKFRALPVPQLVVLGEPGAGKTVLALLFALGMLGSRESGEPVPVLLPAASWNPSEEFLDDWMVRQLSRDYPALTNRRAYGRKAVPRLVEQRRIIPVLDGLDELPPDAHVRAIEGIDRAAAAGRPLVVTCRSDEFQHAVEAGGTTLATAAVVELRQVDAEDAIAFLSAGLPRTTSKWRPVFAQLREEPEGPLATAFATPLMVSLARTIYTHPEPDPAELLDRDRFATATTIEHHLLDAYLPAVYTDQPTEPSTSDTPRAARSYPAEQASRWLEFLAHRLADLNTRDVAWWHLNRTNAVVPVAWAALLGVLIFSGRTEVATGVLLGVSIDCFIEQVSSFKRGRRAARSLLTGLAVLACAVLFSVTNVGESGNLLIDGLAFAVLLAWSIPNGRGPRRVAVRVRLLRPFVLRVVGMSFLVGLAVGTGAIGVAVDDPVTEFDVLGFAVVVGFLWLAVAGPGTWSPVLSQGVRVPRPIDVLRWDRTSTFVRLLLPVAFLQALVVFSIVVLGRHADSHEVASSWNFGIGLGLGAAAKSAWVSSWPPRLWWALRGRLPWRLMAFLDDGHRRGVLRQVGAVYQFRHAHLQDRLVVERPSG
ncbi:NACHT domain-containing protein [Saccharopolyspora kobensis]|uniref:NACHT domain-containing protein n=1 Tax=Saccharopolyspora kobensis TaxID=146035 RepID=A0A1H5TTN1_9PSEU|nr:NACHT domain-containing protein [Saccharopolyspora kobensis]SEF66130.1 NACHT domain-containing protein [Saccharopolyspora kobensis]SFC42560.1 NACHT domain-containing protein [Saccharopolyspora kobensis]